MQFERYETSQVALPNAPGPEKSILSSMLQEPADFIPAAQEAGLAKDWFHIPSHGRLWEVLLELHEQEKPIELVSLTGILKDRDNMLENMGGSGELTAIYTYSPTGAHFDHHLGIVRDKWFRRNVLSHCRKVSEACYDAEDGDEVVSLLSKPVEELLDDQDNSATSTGAECVGDWLDDWKLKFDGEVEMDIVSSGVEVFDDVRGGIDKPGLTYIGGFPSMGKTAMWLQIAVHRLQQGDRVLLFSLEMTKRQLISRLMIHLCQFDDPATITEPSRGSVTKDEMLRIRDAAEILSSDNLIIDDRSGITIEQIEAKVKLEHRKGKLGFIGVDYAQLVGANKVDSVEQRMTSVTHGLQRIMKSTRAAVVCLSQLTMKEGGATEMKYARSLEEDADLAARILGNVEEKVVTGVRWTKDRQRGKVGWYPQVRFDKRKQTFWNKS